MMIDKKIVLSTSEPSKQVLWLKEGLLYQFGANGWQPIGLSSEEVKNLVDKTVNDLLDGALEDLDTLAASLNCVQYDTEQTLTEEQKGQARNNIGAVGFSDKALINLLAYGVEWDTTVADPDCQRIGNPLLHKELPIQSKLRGCVANGTNINYYLYSEDWAYKEDGTTASILDGTDGTIRVDTGSKFYGKSETEGTKKRVLVSTVRIDNSWTEIPRLLIDAVKPTLDRTDPGNIKTAAVVNITTNFRGGNNNAILDKYL